jgi:hypothetical protein
MPAKEARERGPRERHVHEIHVYEIHPVVRDCTLETSARLLSPTYDEANVQNWLHEVREARERSSHTISDIEEASLQSRSLEYALYAIVQCLSQVCTYLEDLSCGLIAHLHVLLDQHHCQLWYQNGNDIVN